MCLHYVNKTIYEINFNFMDRIEEVISFVYNNTFKKNIIINIHHNNSLLSFSGNNSENQNI